MAFLEKKDSLFSCEKWRVFVLFCILVTLWALKVYLSSLAKERSKREEFLISGCRQSKNVTLSCIWRLPYSQRALLLRCKHFHWIYASPFGDKKCTQFFVWTTFYIHFHFLSNLPLCPFLKLLLLPLRWLSINCTKPVNLLVDIMYFFHVPIFRIAGVHKNVDHRVYKHRGNPDVLVNAERWFMELGVPELLSPDFVKLNNKDCNCKMLTRSAIPDPARSSVSQPLALYATRMLFLQSHASTFPCQKPPRTITTIPPWTGQT